MAGFFKKLFNRIAGRKDEQSSEIAEQQAALPAPEPEIPAPIEPEPELDTRYRTRSRSIASHCRFHKGKTRQTCHNQKGRAKEARSKETCQKDQRKTCFAKEARNQKNRSQESYR